MSDRLTAENILKAGFGFASSKALLSAVELGLFTELAKGPLSAAELRTRLGLHPRSARDFFDAMVSLGMLERRGDVYANTPETSQFLDRQKSTYVGGILEMCNTRLYGFWSSLTEALRTGRPQNESKTGGDLFASIYSSPERLEQFLSAMTGISLPAAKAIAQKFPWDNYTTFADIGCAEGSLPVQVALHHGHLDGIGYDLPAVKPIFDRYVRSHGLDSRLHFQAGDFFNNPLPRVDVIVMGHILHDWNLEQKKGLIAKAFQALPQGGALLVYEALIDDDRRQNSFGLLMSLNMLIETSGGFDYTGADCSEWMRVAGFRQTLVEHLSGPDSMAIGIK